MFAGFLAKIGISAVAKALPWKWIGVGLAALAIVATIGGGVFYVKGLQDDLVETAGKLAAEENLRRLAEARADDIMDQHNLQIARIATLEIRRKAVAEETLNLRALIDELTTEEDFQNDPDKAVRDLNVANLRLNRLLESISGRKDQLRADGSSGSKAGTTRAPSALQRALEKLRKNGVFDANRSQAQSSE